MPMPPVDKVVPQRWLRHGRVEVEAIRLNAMNVSDIEYWVYAHGGAVAGLCAVAGGPLEDRCLYIGDVYGDIDQARLGDFVVREPEGMFVPWYATSFLAVHELIGRADPDALTDIAEEDRLTPEKIQEIVRRALTR